MVERVFRSARFQVEPRHFTFTINGTERTHSVWPGFTVNGAAVSPTAAVQPDDQLGLLPPAEPTISDVIGFKPEDVAPLEVAFNGVTCWVPTRRYTLSLNGHAAELSDIAPDFGAIEFVLSAETRPTLADVLLAAEFNPADLPVLGGIAVVLNGKVAEYTALVKNGDKIDILIKESAR